MTSKLFLRDKSRFDLIFKTGKRLFLEDFVVFYLPNELTHPRAGIVISKRKCALSVHRNTLRRLVREFVRLNQANLSSRDFIFLQRKNIKNIDKKAVAANLQRLADQFRSVTVR